MIKVFLNHEIYFNLFGIFQNQNKNIHIVIFLLVRMWGKKNACTLLVGMQAGATTLEKNLEAS
jgi:hypothetical protein